MTLDPGSMAEIVGAAVPTIGAVYASITHLARRARLKREERKEEILNLAKAEISRVKQSLESQIKELETELENQKVNVSKDFDNFRKAHNYEVSALGEKIEQLRDDLSQQHKALLDLLTKLVSK